MHFTLFCVTSTGENQSKLRHSISHTPIRAIIREGQTDEIFITHGRYENVWSIFCYEIWREEKSSSTSRVKILRLQFFTHFSLYSTRATCPTYLVLLQIIRPNRTVAVLLKFTSPACIIIHLLHSNLLAIFSWYKKGKQPGIQ